MISLLIFSATWYKLIKCAWSQFHGHLFMHLWTFWIRAAIFTKWTKQPLEIQLSSLTIQMSLKQKLVASSRGLKYSFPETNLEVGLEQLSRHEGDLDWLVFIKHINEDYVQESLSLRSWLLSPVVHQWFTGSTTSSQQCPLCFIFLHWVRCFFPKHIHPVCSIKCFYMCVTPQTQLSFLWKHRWESWHSSRSLQERKNNQQLTLYNKKMNR